LVAFIHYLLCLKIIDFCFVKKKRNGSLFSMSWLGFVRLKCLDPNRTIKFYTECFHFEIKQKVEQERETFIFFQPRGNPHHVGLRFECENSNQLGIRSVAKVPLSFKSAVKLVFYAKRVSEVIIAVEQSLSGGYIYNTPTRHFGVVSALIVDPNGILIQVIELSETLLKDTSVSLNPALCRLNFYGSAVRFGYAEIKSPDAMEHANYYAELFGATEDQGLSIVDNENFPEMLTSYVWLGVGPRIYYSAICFVDKAERPGIKVQRMNGASAFASSSASSGGGGGTHFNSKKLQAQKAFNNMQHEKLLQQSNPFLGIAIVVNDLEPKMNILSRHLRYPINFSSQLVKNDSLGIISTFLDPSGIHVQLIDDEFSPILGKIPGTKPDKSRLNKSILHTTEAGEKKHLETYKELEERRTKRGSVFPARLLRVNH